MKKAVFIFGILLLAIAACQKKMEYPIEPQIAYKGFTYLINEDSTFSGQGILSFSYADGDGDLGLDVSDSLPPFNSSSPYYYNLIIDYQKLENGTFHSVPLLSWNMETQSFDTVSFNARFKRLYAGNESKPISGNMDYTLFVQNPFSPNDTVRFAVKIIDRALHESNVIFTETLYTNPRLINNEKY